MGTSFLRASLTMTVLAALTSASHKGPDASATQNLHTGFTCVNGRLAKSGVRLTPPEERTVRLLLGEPMRPLDEALFAASPDGASLEPKNLAAAPDSGALLKDAEALEQEADRLRQGSRRQVQEEFQQSGAAHAAGPSALIAAFPAETMALQKEQQAAALRRQGKGRGAGAQERGDHVELNALACFRASFPLAPRRSLLRAARAPPPGGGQRGVRHDSEEEEGEGGREAREKLRLFLAAPVGEQTESRTPG